MNHKERLLTAVNHEEPDRVPFCVWYTPEAERTLLRHLGVESDQTETYKAAGGPLPILMDHDFLISWVGPCTSYYSNPAEEYTDEWGIGWKWFRNAVGGSYTEIIRHPLADLVDPTAFTLPDFSSPNVTPAPTDCWPTTAASTASWADAPARSSSSRGISADWSRSCPTWS